MTTKDFNKLINKNLAEKLKQKKLTTNTDLANLEQHIIEKLFEKYKSCKFFISNSYFSDEGSQNFWIFQPTLNTFTIPAGLTETIL